MRRADQLLHFFQHRLPGSLLGRQIRLRTRAKALRQAAATHHKLRFTYRELDGRLTDYTVRPLGCFEWGRVWTLAAWCEDRQAWQPFRLDHIGPMDVLPETFEPAPGQTLADVVHALQADMEASSQALDA